MNIPGLLWWLSGKESAYNTGVVGDASLTLGLGRFPGKEHGNPHLLGESHRQRSLVGYNP